MGFHYNCGDCDKSSTDTLLTEIEKKINEVEPHEDGTLDIEIVVKGKSQGNISLTRQRADELRQSMRFDFQ